MAVAAPLAAPTSIGPGGYALPLVTGWATGNVAHSFDANNNALAIAGGATGSNPTAGYWTIPVSIEVGQSLSAVAMTVRDTAGAPVLASIVAQDVTTRATTTWCSGASAGTGLVNTVTWACSGTTMPAGSQMVVLLTPQGQTATIYGMWMQPSRAVTDTYSVGFAIPGPGVLLTAGAASTGAALILGGSSASSNLPLHVPADRTLTAWSVRMIKNSSSLVVARLWRTTPGSGAAVQVGTTQATPPTTGVVMLLGQSQLADVAPGNASYFIEIVGGGVSGDLVMDYQDTWQ